MLRAKAAVRGMRAKPLLFELPHKRGIVAIIVNRIEHEAVLFRESRRRRGAP